MRIWMATYGGDMPGFTHLYGLDVDITQVTELGVRDIHGATVGFGPVVFQVFATTIDGLVDGRRVGAPPVDRRPSTVALRGHVRPDACRRLRRRGALRVRGGDPGQPATPRRVRQLARVRTLVDRLRQRDEAGHRQPLAGDEQRLPVCSTFAISALMRLRAGGC